MVSKDDACKSLNVYRVILLIILALFFARLGIHIFISMTATPPAEELLLNRQGAIFSGEDLSQPGLSEGQVKQIFFETVVRSLEYNYLEFVSDEEYVELLSEGIPTDLPDHRDVIMPWFTGDMYEEFLEALKSAPWMRDIHNERLQLNVSATSPPIRENINSPWSLSSDGVLSATYKGFLYVQVTSPVVRAVTYRVDYQGSISRVPLTDYAHKNDYYFTPLVELNTTGWGVSELNLEITRRNR